jgi:hypothetical protein
VIQLNDRKIRKKLELTLFTFYSKILNWFLCLFFLNKAATLLLLAYISIANSDFISPWTAGWSAVIVTGHPAGYNDGGHPGHFDDSNDSSSDMLDPENFPSIDDESATYATQYIAQDELGQTSFGYAHPGQAATNYRDAWGNQVGNWAFISPEGQKIIVAYIADDQGFRAFSDHLPVAPSFINVAPTETLEVAAARAQHLAAYQIVKDRDVLLIPPSAPSVDYTQSVTDTPEVKMARAEFMKLFNEVKTARAV